MYALLQGVVIRAASASTVVLPSYMLAAVGVLG
jgi:hypothetical protein